MSTYNYFIEKQLPFVFRYKYSNPNIIRTVFIKDYNEDKGLIVTSEAFTCKIKTFKIDGIHFYTRDLFPTYDVEDEVSEDEYKKCNENKHEFLKCAIENNKTVAFSNGWFTYVMSPYRFCNFGKSVLMYNEKDDMFRIYDIEEIKFVPIPKEVIDVELSDVDEPDYELDDFSLESSCDDDILTEKDILNEHLDISAIDEINDWE